jgi:hypothetical protein
VYDCHDAVYSYERLTLEQARGRALGDEDYKADNAAFKGVFCDPPVVFFGYIS